MMDLLQRFHLIWDEGPYLNAVDQWLSFYRLHQFRLQEKKFAQTIITIRNLQPQCFARYRVLMF